MCLNILLLPIVALTTDYSEPTSPKAMSKAEPRLIHVNRAGGEM